MTPPVEQVTADGYDLQLGTNVLGIYSFMTLRSCSDKILLGHFYLTKLLLPVLLRTPGARVINTSSLVHAFTGKMDFDTFKDGPKRKALGTQRLYVQSKFVRGGICISHFFF